MLEVKQNFSNKYTKSNNQNIDLLLCPLCQAHVDNAQNIFTCSVLNNDVDVSFEDLFSNNTDKLAAAIKQFYKLWTIRKRLLENKK